LLHTGGVIVVFEGREFQTPMKNAADLRASGDVRFGVPAGRRTITATRLRVVMLVRRGGVHQRLHRP